MMYYGAGHFSAWAWILMSVGMLVLILAIRFARGEIEEAEYRDRIAGLRGHMRT